MLFKNSNFTHLLPKHLALKKVLNNVRSITKSDTAIEIDPTTYCNISPQNQGRLLQFEERYRQLGRIFLRFSSRNLASD